MKVTTIHILKNSTSLFCLTLFFSFFLSNSRFDSKTKRSYDNYTFESHGFKIFLSCKSRFRIQNSRYLLHKVEECFWEMGNGILDICIFGTRNHVQRGPSSVSLLMGRNPAHLPAHFVIGGDIFTINIYYMSWIIQILIFFFYYVDSKHIN